MNGIKQVVLVSSLLGAAAVAFSDSPSSTATTSYTAELVSKFAARQIAEAIPREYARTKDWGRTRQVTTGVRSAGNFFDFDIHSKKSTVNHGIWKSYRVTLVDPEKNLDVKIENLRTERDGHVALTLFITAKLHGWARRGFLTRGRFRSLAKFDSAALSARLPVVERC